MTAVTTTAPEHDSDAPSLSIAFNPEPEDPEWRVVVYLTPPNVPEAIDCKVVLLLRAPSISEAEQIAMDVTEGWGHRREVHARKLR